ncbi:MAG: hypothetical protein ACJ8E3_03100 [Sphingomicrobium sp.]
MLFMIAAYLKPGIERQLLDFRNELNEHFAQDALAVAGALHDQAGDRKGYLGFVEGDSFEDAERFVRQGPFYQEQLYERIEIFRYELEVGHIGA